MSDPNLAPVDDDLVEGAEPDRYAGLPAEWSLSARETYASISEANPDLSEVALSTLYEAASLLALADQAQAQVDRDGMISRGSQGQPVAHPLLAEIRLLRVGAMTALRALGIAPNQSKASKAGAALVSARWDRQRKRGAL